jgi:recombinational DNA repair protein (RecF pathway)
MHTNGPEHHDCAGCGKRIKNEPRVTTASGRILCKACHQTGRENEMIDEMIRHGVGGDDITKPTKASIGTALKDTQDALEYVRGIATLDRSSALYLIEAEQALRRAVSRLTQLSK